MRSHKVLVVIIFTKKIQIIKPMDSILDLLATYILSYPGAFFRMLILRIFGRKVTFSECLDQDATQNALIASLFIGLFILIFRNL